MIKLTSDDFDNNNTRTCKHLMEFIFIPALPCSNNFVSTSVIKD